jgi:alanine-glyoxylate transaminase/serine-glyoxylate transaminase/serine-pyruvate transaminase
LASAIALAQAGMHVLIAGRREAVLAEACEALRLTLAEGLEERWARHEATGRHVQAAVRERGFDLVADPAHQLPHLTAVRVPDGIDGKRVQQRLLDEHGIEVGGGLGPDAPPMWRIGTMGVNASIEVADRVLAALDAVLTDEPVPRVAQPAS